ncbi:hypothetical protein A3A54_00230 [Candidatus Curtissbacteria bacterium RIFCSPLOWO2_01_FULL_39_62]|uniref:DNA polymerase III subunit delta n=2 Tax=Candidatus Curtissiibacteriota TaxID=1752717 RepID=A0A1F5GAT0_9BACT|nr:MAG: hypothetical protein A2775_00850 [Candidatus Curtissbacteria bacterium RIFCSPHIGHO2_01_FULL_39_57]OGD88944.1 MAG: hypothetical protein A3D04_01980 [Candidatus Curtissbacteria bacterium RIFCSPHIGHO2_02_FULL_40_16b]OGD90694.1 MAG: hypothetical protein A3E11_00975 [Candidatus Curtissbacteria bacterium RIFCSPHIGHO2_12_FULL_38_37]OGE00717.1 MAG: hypothetical protein A3J17_04155 [Candidatus Curtissbacteria bacterium RIFCSPLOWO2_02_FULL_40_11]OGE02443.1 MAG: hypothetical protein A3A54_00230 [C
MVKTTQSKFQSFLIIGKGAKTESNKIADSFNINLQKQSPDISIISPQKKSISIDQIRQLKKQIDQKPVSDSHKLIVIKDAQNLTKQAQNSLLKIFEEPPPHAIIILEAKDKSDLLPTIVSRAVMIKTSAKHGIEPKSSILLSDKKTQELLEEISQIEDPIVWIDDQMNSLHESLLTNIRSNKNNYSLAEIRTAQEKCAEAKKMIEANVDAKFVLANLIFSLKLDA